jgi:hypothetical protein
MRAPDCELPTVVAELLRAITSGREPNLSTTELAALAAYIQSLKPDRRGRSKVRHIQGANRRLLRTRMEFLKIKLRRDPAEPELKRRGNYDLNNRVAEVMHARLEKSGYKNPPNVESLKNILSRSTANDDPRDPW